MKEYCVDLEIAKELKENGFPQKTNYSWVTVGHGNFMIKWDIRKTKNSPIYNETPAPTSDEILKELPNKLFYSQKHITPDKECHIEIYRRSDKWYDVAYGYIDLDGFNRAYTLNFQGWGSLDKKLPNALAKTWLYLKKEGHLK